MLRDILIRSWKHKGLKKFFETGNYAGIQAKHVSSLRFLLFQLAAATQAKDMNTPGNDFHKLSGTLNGFFSVKVNANWRVIFRFEGVDALDVNYIDYH